jgi:putative transposase
MCSRKLYIENSQAIDTWPQVCVEALTDDQRQIYENKAKAVRLYLANVRAVEIREITGVSCSYLARLARRCFETHPDGRIYGFRGLLPYVRLKEYERTAPENIRFLGSKGGLSGMLTKLLRQYPKLEEALVNSIRQTAKVYAIPEYKIRARDLHRIFLRYLKSNNHSQSEWPFTTKYLGKRTIESYMKSLLESDFRRTVSTRGNQEARAHMSVGTGRSPFLVYDEPFSAVELDAYSIESHLTAAILTPEGTEVECLLDRIWLIAAVDSFSSAILAYCVVYRSEVNADDVLGLIRAAATEKWEPRDCKLPIKYPKGGGMPSGVIPKAFGAVWTSLLLDGALVHLSKAVHERARQTLGFSVNWGPSGHFERRPNVEKTFDKIGKELFKRLPSTTGGGPNKGRAIDAQKKAIRYRIRASDIEELLDVTIAQHNLLPSSGISNLSPLEVLNQFIENDKEPLLIRRLPNESFEYAKSFALSEKATVRGNIESGRRPYVQLDGVHYTNDVLASAAHLIGKSLILRVDENDYRQVIAYLSNGAELGVLKAKGKWGATKHTRRTRKAINSLVSRRILILSEFDDPVHEYMKLIARQGKQKKREGELAPRQVTQLVQLARDAEVEPRLPAADVQVQDKREHPVSSPVKPSTPGIIGDAATFFVRTINRR